MVYAENITFQNKILEQTMAHFKDGRLSVMRASYHSSFKSGRWIHATQGLKH